MIRMNLKEIQRCTLRPETPADKDSSIAKNALIGLISSSIRKDRIIDRLLDDTSAHIVQCKQHLENCTNDTQDAPREGVSMSKHRMRVCVDYNDDGTPVIKQVGADSELALADKVARTILQSKRRTEFVTDEPANDFAAIPLFKTYAEEYMRTYKEPRIKPTTLSYYRQILDNYLYPTWGETQIDQIQTEDVQQFLNRYKHLSEKYLKEMRVFLKAILESARQDKLIADNPASDKRIQIPSKKKSVRKPLEMDDIREIASALSQLEDQDRRFVALMLYTGMRRGEVLGLCWEDIDFDAAEIHVQQNVTYPAGANQPHIGSTKTANGARTIPMAAELIEMLQPAKENGFVIGGEQPVTLSVVRRMNERIGRTIDMHGASPHIFRHSFATMLNDTGADVKTIQSVLGDADFKTVADRYVHPREDRKRTAVANVGRMLAN